MDSTRRGILAQRVLWRKNTQLRSQKERGERRRCTGSSAQRPAIAAWRHASRRTTRFPPSILQTTWPQACPSISAIRPHEFYLLPFAFYLLPFTVARWRSPARRSLHPAAVESRRRSPVEPQAQSPTGRARSPSAARGKSSRRLKRGVHISMNWVVDILSVAPKTGGFNS